MGGFQTGIKKKTTNQGVVSATKADHWKREMELGGTCPGKKGGDLYDCTGKKKDKKKRIKVVR